MPTENMNVKDIFTGNIDHLTSNEPETCEFTFESPIIRHIQSDRYELIKDLVKWAVLTLNGKVIRNEHRHNL